MGLESTALGLVGGWDASHEHPDRLHFRGSGGVGAIPAGPLLAHLEALFDRLDSHSFACLGGTALGDVPGLEIVADGVDPRAGLLLDGLSEKKEPPRVGRMFVYQRNVERVCASLLHLEDDLLYILQSELIAAFPEAAKKAGLEPPPSPHGPTDPA